MLLKINFIMKTIGRSDTFLICGVGQVGSVCAFYSDDLSSNSDILMTSI